MQCVSAIQRAAGGISPNLARLIHTCSLCFALLWLFPEALNAGLNPAEHITQYKQDVWTIAAGLPHNSVDAIAQTPDGYLWIGTEDGLARFDGVRFVTFDSKNTPALQSNHISALLADHSGNLWIGTQGGGLTRLQHGEFKRYTTANRLIGDTILSLSEDAQGAIWIGTDSALARYADDAFRTYTSKDGLPDGSVFALAADKDGGLWIGTHAGLAKLYKGNFRVYTVEDGLPDSYIKCLKLSRNGDLWIGTNGGGLSQFANGRFINYTVRNGILSKTIWSLAEDDAGSIWVGTFDAGINRIQNGRISSYGAKDGVPSNRVFALFQDREASLWIGTGGAGLVRLRGGPFVSITSREGLSNDVVLPVYQDSQGAIWVGTNGGGVNRIANGKVANYSTRNGLSDNLVFSVSEYKDGSLWVATHKELDRLKDGAITLYGKANGLPGDSILCLFRDREGDLWAGSRGGLSKFDGTRFQTYTTKDGLSSDYVVSLYQDHAGTLWIGTGGGGLDAFKDGHFHTYTTKDGLSSNAVWALTGDSDGTLWIGTAGGGLNRFQHGRFTTYTVHQGLFDDEIFQILEDRYGFLWMSSNRGVFRVAKIQLNAISTGAASSVTSIPYGISDGMKSEECNGGFQPAGWQTRDGRLLFPTMKGVAIVDPSLLNRKMPPTPALIESVTVDGVELDRRRAAIAKPGEGKLEVTFTALNLIDSDKIQFRYRLDGFDKTWIYAGQRRTAYYTNLPPGNYRFIAAARNADGEWNKTGDSVSLTLLPHFYQTNLFLIACVGTFAALCLGGYKLRIRALEANERRLLDLVDQRTQDLQVQMNAKERAHAELAAAQQSLLELSRRSGMAEVATGVLHNVGNVLNSVNVGAGVINTKLRELRTDNLIAAVKMLHDNVANLSGYVESDPKGQRLLPYLSKLADHLQAERTEVLSEIDSLTGHIEHIKEIVNTQQDYARASALTEVFSIPKVVDQALKVVGATLSRHHVDVVCEIEEVPDVSLPRHRVVEILVNLIRNAKQAVIEQNGPQRQVRIRARNYGNGGLRLEVHDTGVGLSAENLTRVFAHGFTTKRDGHGFGLHSSALAAKQMGCSLWAESDGPGHGATFILEMPAEVTAKAQELSTV